MGQRETSVDLGLCRISRSEERVKFVLRIDRPRVGVAKFGCALEKVVLDGIEHPSGLSDEFVHPEKFLRFDRLIATTHRDLAGFEVARSELNPQWHAFLDPIPI